MELNRFKQLLEATMGNVKPLIMEQEIETLLTWAKEKNKDNKYCTPEETQGAWKYCPRGTWKYTMKDDKFDYYDKEGNLISSDSKITPTQEKYNGTVNNIQNLARWVKDKSTDVSGNWAFSYDHLKFYDDKNSFIGSIGTHKF
jgi:hypothetical protein